MAEKCSEGNHRSKCSPARQCIKYVTERNHSHNLTPRQRTRTEDQEEPFPSTPPGPMNDGLTPRLMLPSSPTKTQSAPLWSADPTRPALVGSLLQTHSKINNSVNVCLRGTFTWKFKFSSPQPGQESKMFFSGGK